MLSEKAKHFLDAKANKSSAETLGKASAQLRGVIGLLGKGHSKKALDLLNNVRKDLDKIATEIEG